MDTGEGSVTLTITVCNEEILERIIRFAKDETALLKLKHLAKCAENT